MWDERFKLVEDLVHSAEEDLAVRRKLLDQVDAFLDEVALLCLIYWLRGQLDNPWKNQLSIILIRHNSQQLNCLLSQCNIIILQTL